MRDFNHTVNVLVKAYLDDTLEHGVCSACAVGNIVGGSLWAMFFQSDSYNGTQAYSASTPLPWFKMVGKKSQNKARRQIKKSGYSRKELARIEFAFETADQGETEDEWIFNGLMAVVEVLADIHQISLEAKEKSKLLFVKL